MSFSTGGLFVNESVETARLHNAQEGWNKTLVRALESSITLLPKVASNRRTLREIVTRVACLTESERLFLVDHADRDERAALLWIATCRAYRFVGEFAIEVIQERYMSYRFELPFDIFDQFFESKAEWDSKLSGINILTRSKLRQVLFRILREAGIIDEFQNIRRAHLSARLHSLIEHDHPIELLLFPGLGSNGDAA
jgi:hypothetical protein